MKSRARKASVGLMMERLSSNIAARAGSTPAFLGAFAIILVWLALGPVFKYSDTWQLVINTTTTIITFLMVFLIQRAQNKDARAVALKLNELIASTEGASNRLIDAEDLSESELETLRQHYRELIKMAKKDDTLTRSHSVEEAQTRHQSKLQSKGRRRTG